MMEYLALTIQQFYHLLTLIKFHQKTGIPVRSLYLYTDDLEFLNLIVKVGDKYHGQL